MQEGAASRGAALSFSARFPRAAKPPPPDAPDVAGRRPPHYLLTLPPPVRYSARAAEQSANISEPR